MDLDELKVYGRAMEIGEKVWLIVNGWNYFQKDTLGKQLVRAVDSIAANLSKVLGGIITKKKEIMAITHADLCSKPIPDQQRLTIEN